jgi:hypothetical protein
VKVVGGLDHFVKQLPIQESHIVRESPYRDLPSLQRFDFALQVILSGGLLYGQDRQVL